MRPVQCSRQPATIFGRELRVRHGKSGFLRYRHLQKKPLARAGNFVAAAQARVEAAVNSPFGCSIVWGGQFNYQQRPDRRLDIVLRSRSF